MADPAVYFSLHVQFEQLIEADHAPPQKEIIDSLVAQFRTNLEARVKQGYSITYNSVKHGVVPGDDDDE